MKKDCSPSKLKAYKGFYRPSCGCAACLKKFAEYQATENEDEACDAAVDFFWLRFSQLVHETLDIVPEAYQDDLKVRLEEHTSVYGIDE